MDLRSYTLEELEDYLAPLYSVPGSTVPISPLRLQSYLANPRANSNDVVLFEMIHKNQLVGYRTLLPDLFYDQKGVPQRFAWLSGNWVFPGERRRGISTHLLLEAEKKWEGRLMYTNYAPDSKALYDHTGRFPTIARREGRRYYLKSNAEELLGERIKSTSLLRLGDKLVNQLRERKLENYTFRENSKISTEAISRPDQDLAEMISALQKESLFRRDMAVFNWALDKPWVSDQKPEPLDYHFSYGASRFENLLYAFRNQESGKSGFLWLIVHNSTLSAPYLFNEDSEILSTMASTLVKTMIGRDCSHTTIRHPGLNEKLGVFGKLFLTSREMPQLVFAHKNISHRIPSEAEIQDGDGDVMFTG